MTLPSHQIIRSKRRTIALVVTPDGSVLVRAPMRASGTAIEEFIRKHLPWIEKHQAKALANLPPPLRYIPGETFPYLGRDYPLEIVEDGSLSDRSIAGRPLWLEHGRFKLCVSHQGDAAKTFERWYRDQARQVLTGRVESLSRQHDFQYKSIRITSARTRWGSCSATGSLSFSWRLIQAPLEVVDYVVIHELVHTVIHNHSKGFWRSVGAIMPHYPQHRKWLREHGRTLLNQT